MTTIATPPLSFESFKTQVSERFEKLGKGNAPDCPMCEKGSWTTLGYTEMTSFDWDGNITGVLASFPIICKSCGFVAHFAKRSFEDG